MTARDSGGAGAADEPGAGGAAAGVAGAPGQAVVPGIARAEVVVISKRRGQPSNRRIDEAERERVVGLVRQFYEDFGPTLA